MSSGPIEESPQLLSRTIHDLHILNYAAASALTILVYDCLLTFAREYDYIWRAKWSLPKALFLFARYYGVCHVAALVIFTTRMSRNIPIDVCKVYIWWSSMAGPVLFATVVNCIFILRLYALYDRSKRVLIFLILITLTEATVDLYICYKVSMTATQGLMNAPFGLPFTGCLLGNIDIKFTLGSWIPHLTVSTLFFFMTSVKFFKAAKTDEGAFRSAREWKSFSPLLTTFVRDGTVFFLLMVVILSVATINTIVAEGSLKGVFTPLLVGVYSFAGSRLILQLREAARKLEGAISHEAAHI